MIRNCEFKLLACCSRSVCSCVKYAEICVLCGIVRNNVDFYFFGGFVADFCLSCAHGAPRHVSCCFVQRCYREFSCVMRLLPGLWLR